MRRGKENKEYLVVYNSFYTRSNQADKGFLKVTTGQEREGKCSRGEAWRTNQSFLKIDGRPPEAAGIKEAGGVILFAPLFNTALN